MSSIVREIEKRRDTSIDHLITHIRERTTNLMDPTQWYHHQRHIYTSIVPNHSENRIRVHQGCYLRKFCPDGKHLLAFSQDQHSVEVFRFKGASSAYYLYDNKDKTGAAGQLYHERSEHLFETFFEHEISISVSRSNDALNRECSLFLSDENSVIVASSVPIPDEPYPHMYETFRNNESVSPNNRFVLEHYTLYLVHLDKNIGSVTDSYSFKFDKIFLSHNQGLSLSGSKLAVLSTKHQSIHIFEVIRGKFIYLSEIGRFCYPDDSLIFEAGMSFNNSNSSSSSLSRNDIYQPFLEKWINSLKHRLLCFIKEQAEARCTPTDPTPLMDFYKRFNYFNALRIWKLQLLDEHTLLLKYTTEDVVTLRVSDPISHPAFFVLYDIETTRVFAVYENSSNIFLHIYENYSELFRTAVSHPLAQDTNSVSNCRHCRSLHMKFKQTITNARHGGTIEATKRLLVQVPVCSQSFSCSPYLDLNLFKYDDKWISPLERPKPCGDAPVRFFSRKSSQLLFCLNMTHINSVITSSSGQPKKLVAYIFHPYEPFLISIQKIETDYIVNFHFRKK